MSTLWILLTSGTVFGWASFLLVYQDEGVYNWQCNSSLVPADDGSEKRALQNAPPDPPIILQVPPLRIFFTLSLLLFPFSAVNKFYRFTWFTLLLFLL